MVYFTVVSGTETYAPKGQAPQSKSRPTGRGVGRSAYSSYFYWGSQMISQIISQFQILENNRRVKEERSWVSVQPHKSTSITSHG
jgi:hypothetical protein